MTQKKKVLLYALVLVVLSVSGALTFASVQASRACSTLTVTDYHVSSGLDPWGTAFDGAGNVWVAVPGCNPNPDCGNKVGPGKIEVFNPSSSAWTKTIQLPSGYGQALFLAFDASGNLWFPMFHTNQLGEYDTSGVFHTWTMPTAASGPWDLVFDHTGKLWITEHFVNRIAEFDPTANTVAWAFRLEVATPASNSQPYGITVDASNNIWFTANNSSVALIGEYTAAGQLQEYKIRNTSSSGLTPHMITVDPKGNIWWTEGWTGMIGKLNIAQAGSGPNNGVTEYDYTPPCTTCSEHTSGISFDSNGLIWFDDSLQDIFGSFPDSGSGSFSLYNVPTSNGHPNDGLNVDGQNRIWFDEEIANKLAKAVQTIAPTPPPTSGS